MTVVAARAPETTWYPIGACRRSNVPVVVLVDGGAYELLATIKKHPRRKLWWWYSIGSNVGKGWSVTAERPLEMVGRDPPTRFSPTAFRPLIDGRWPDPLPAPLEATFGPVPATPATGKPLPAPEPIDLHTADDGWPYPGLRLGACTPPATLEECEARLLRAFRTSTHAAGVGGGGDLRGYCGDIPTEYAKIALKHEADLRRAEEYRLGIQTQPLDAVRSAWEPLRRDWTDWDTALSWLYAAGVSGKARDAISLRAADPPFSWRQVGEQLRISHTRARALYATAIAAAFNASRRGS